MNTSTSRYVYCKADGCKTMVELRGVGPTPCPECSTPNGLTYSEGRHNLALQERLYGTSNNPVYNTGLGTWTTGKQDRRAKARARKLIPRDE